MGESTEAQSRARRANAAKARAAKNPPPACELDRLVVGLVDILMPKQFFELKDRTALRDMLAAFAAEIRQGSSAESDRDV